MTHPRLQLQLHLHLHLSTLLIVSLLASELVWVNVLKTSTLE
jgi:hypothetical protein